MPQVNLPTKQKQTHRHREQTCQGFRELGEGWSGRLELADISFDT